MSRNKKTKFYDDFDEDDFYERGSNSKDKRKTKYLNRAIKTKDIDAILELEEDEDE
jgi:hypothetical protein